MTSDAAAYFPDTLAVQPNLEVAEQQRPPAANTQFEDLPQVKVQDAGLSDELLLAEVARGSRESLGILFRRHQRTVSNVALRILKDASEAEDLCQEVFIFVFQRAKLFDASKGSASSWIIQIAYHRALNRRQYLTVRQHYDAHELEEERLDPDNRRLFVDAVVAKTLLNRLRQQVSIEQRQTLELHLFDGYSFREIAEKTGQTLGNVRNHYYRGLERLRACVFPQKGV